MFKKLMIASAVLALSSSVAFATNYKGDYKGEAAPAPCPTYTYTAGPYLGLSIGDRTNYNGAPATFKGLDGNLSAGYGMMMSPEFYLAGEAFVLGTAKIKDLKNVNVNPNVSTRSNWGWGLSILPGYMLNDHVLGYVRLGGIDTHFNGTGVNSSKWGWQVGPGVQFGLAPNWDLRAEYSYAQYRSVSNLGNVSANVASLGLVYKFV